MFSERLTLILERLCDTSEEVQTNAIDMLYEEVRASVGTITTEQQELLDLLEKLKPIAGRLEGKNKKITCDLISVLSVGSTDYAIKNVMMYRLEGNVTSFEEWGHFYVKQLILGCIKIRNREIEVFNYFKLVEPICEFLFKHNSEIEAIDFLLEIGSLKPKILCDLNQPAEKGTEVDQFEMILTYVDEDNFERIYLYLVELNKFYDLREIILQMVKNRPTLYLVHLIEFRRLEEVIEYVKKEKSENLKKQFLYILARCNIFYEGDNAGEKHILENKHITENFLQVNNSLEIMEASKMDYIFKGLNNDKVEAAAVCNGFVHYGFLRDPLFKRVPTDYNIKPEYISLLNQCNSKTINASIGCVYGFNPDLLIEEHPENVIELKDLGTLLGVAIAGSKGNGSDFLFDSFCEHLSSEDTADVVIALQGISLIYAGCAEDKTKNTRHEKIFEKLFPLLNHNSIDVVCMTIYTISTALLNNVPETCIALYIDIFNENNLSQSPFYLYAILGIALTLFRRSDENAMDLFSNLPRCVQCLSYGLMNMGSGSPDAIEEILNSVFVGDFEPLNESLGLVSAALVAIGDPLATQMVENQLMSALHLNNVHIKKTVPLCLSLLYASSNKQSVVEYLERSIHSPETEVSAIVALGIVGAGTKNAKILQILSGAFGSMYKENVSSNALLYAQGLVNLGKGTLTISPLAYGDKIILDKSILGLLTTILMLFTDDYACFADYSHLMYGIVSAIRPKYVTGVQGEIKVGRSVERVGLSGNPSKLAGKVIHQAPVILNYGEEAETEECVLTDFIEDVLVLK
ncbi:RPN1 [Ecytonucleospora hepatopenaei]|uniref:RPN1 n=1 Tax=Ecytonucleospora hepatopenaei TaxID=646526 RepID=A0A1W0E6I1_9MICR|nr:RPN1 [Ecytonucleospora hepatopenaei]